MIEANLRELEAELKGMVRLLNYVPEGDEWLDNALDALHQPLEARTGRSQAVSAGEKLTMAKAALAALEGERDPIQREILQELAVEATLQGWRHCALAWKRQAEAKKKKRLYKRHESQGGAPRADESDDVKMYLDASKLIAEASAKGLQLSIPRACRKAGWPSMSDSGFYAKYKRGKIYLQRTPS